jgi:ribulose-phosphate 3-epimerase
MDTVITSEQKILNMTNKPIQVSASILCADFSKLASEIKRSQDAGVDRFHIDVMDGHFVPNITIGPIIISAIRPHTNLPLEAHLMVEHPGDYIDAFADAGADIIQIQVECYGERRAACRLYGQYPKEVDTIDVERIRKDLLRIKGRGKKAYVVINPGTPLCIDSILDILDGVLVMSVNPGFAKQKFNADVLPKIEMLSRKFKGDIAIDGGVNAQTAPDAVKAGAHILITASYLYGSSDLKGTIKDLKSLPVRS